MAARVGTHLPRVRAAARAAKIQPVDTAGLRLAEHLAQLLDLATARAEELPDEIDIYQRLGPLYLRTLTALGLTRDGRAVGDTTGAPGGVSKEVAARDRLRLLRDGRAV